MALQEHGNNMLLGFHQKLDVFFSSSATDALTSFTILPVKFLADSPHRCLLDTHSHTIRTTWKPRGDRRILVDGPARARSPILLLSNNSVHFQNIYMFRSSIHLNHGLSWQDVSKPMSACTQARGFKLNIACASPPMSFVHSCDDA
jgi:hypothetical protein